MSRTVLAVNILHGIVLDGMLKLIISLVLIGATMTLSISSIICGSKTYWKF